MGTALKQEGMPDNLNHYIFENYHFAVRYHLTNEDLVQLVKTFQTSDHSAGSVLGGRRSASRNRLKEIGPVVIKHYRRGGLLAYLVRRTYLGLGKRRCQVEFEQMDKVRRLGVLTPEPVAYAFRGRLFYQAWLITREIEQHQSMADLSRSEPTRAASALVALCHQVSVLIENNILHADFHPGNILVDDRDQVFLIDFDKSTIYKTTRQNLKEKYWRRWHRSVSKHGLPKMLSEIMRKHLLDE